MATMQPPMMPPGAQPEAEPMDPMGTDDQEQGYCIEIKVSPGGTFKVSVESAAFEAKEHEAAGEEADGGSRECKSVKEALTLALEIFKNDGQMPVAGEADDAFMAGYGGDTAPKAP